VKCVLIEGTDEVYRFACVELLGGDRLPAYSAELPGLVEPLPGSPYPWGDRSLEAL